MRAHIFLVLPIALGLPAGPLRAQLPVPPGWQWRLDAPALVSSATDRITDSTVGFARMPPGWHMTTGPGTLFYNPRFFVERSFTVQTQLFHFPNSGAGEYGLFVGGRDLDAPTARYVAFVVRKDGGVAAFEQVGAQRRMLAEWRRAEAVRPNEGQDVVGNLLQLAVTRREAVLRVNRLDALIVPLDGLVLDGAVGFRVGPGLNLHASTLDVTNRIAPTPGEQ